MRSRVAIAGAALAATIIAGAPALAQDAQRPALTAVRMPAPGVKAPVEPAQAPRLTGVKVPMEAKVVTGAPYSAEVVIESVQVLADGNRIVSKVTGRVYRDTQGRTRREEDHEPGRLASVAITDPVASVSISLDPESKTAWKTPAGMLRSLAPKFVRGIADPAEIERQRSLDEELNAVAGKVATARVAEAPKEKSAAGAPAAIAPAGRGGRTREITTTPWEETTEKLPARNIEGVMAEGTRTTRTIPAGAIGNEQPIVSITEEWVSPQLQALVMTRTSDPRSGEYTYRLLNIVRAEPNGSWFDVPADYTVRDVRVAPAVRPRR